MKHHEGHSPIDLGPFVLHNPLGEGGMSQVWRGVHREQGVEVAVKIMREEHAVKPHIRQSFLLEVQSMARMQHPGIIKVFDYGHVPESTARQSNGALCYDAPFITMELATRGSLGALNGIFSWRQLRWLLLEILNALAHAHARDLIHRDLKPDNVLMTTDERGATRLKLTDFGIVHVSDPDVSSQTSDLKTLFAGTPHYMAPEQLRGKWREFGPWTDLYSLGCMAYEACCGRPPYDGENLFDIAHHQMTTDVPPLTPRTPVPEELEHWIMRMLAKDPYDRFQRAADAAWALLQLPSPDEFIKTQQDVVLVSNAQPDETPQGNDLSDVTWVLEANPLHTTQNTIHSDLIHTLADHIINVVEDQLPDREPKIREYSDAPPFTPSWKRRRPPMPSIQLLGAGLNIYSIREVPYVAREHERNRIWQKLTQVHHQQSPLACIVRGQTGIGKSRLVNWIHERANELGSATILQTGHSPDVDTNQGIARMVSRELKCAGLPRQKVYQRLKKILSSSATHHETTDLDAMALTELIEPGEESLTEKGPKITLNTSYERYIVVSRLLRFLCQERPVIIVLDDAQWSHDSLECARLILTQKETADLPVFIILTLNDDAQHSVPQPNIQSIRKIVQGRKTEEILLAPLHDREQDELIEQLLPLHPALSQELKNLSRGNPMFIVQLIRDWIDNNILEIDGQYYNLREGVTPFKPTTLNQLWKTRLAKLIRTVRRRTPNYGVAYIRQVLELSAALGTDIFFNEWGIACRSANLSVPALMLAALVDQGFVEVRHDGWSFTHDVLREQLIMSAKQENRWHDYHRACAAMIDELYDRHTQGAPERLLYHLIEANEPKLALTPLHYLLDRAMLQCDYHQAEQYTKQLGQLLHTGNVPADDPQRGHLAIQQALLSWQMDGAHTAILLMESVRAQCDQYQWTTQKMLANQHLVGWYTSRGQYGQAHALCLQCAEHFAEQGNAQGLCQTFIHLAKLQRLGGELKQARRTIVDAIELIVGDREIFDMPDGDKNLVAKAYLQLGVIYRQDDRAEKATVALKRAQMLFKQVGNQVAHEHSRTELGHLARHQESLFAAERFYLDAHEVLSELDHVEMFLPHLGYALVLLDQSRFDEALDMLHEDYDHLQEIEHFEHTALLYSALLLTHTGLNQDDQADLQIQQLIALTQSDPCVDRDVGHYLLKSAQHPCTPLHRRANILQLAYHHFSVLGQKQTANDIKSQLAQMQRSDNNIKTLKLTGVTGQEN